jgi:iron complex transport system ATP-binding protein
MSPSSPPMSVQGLSCNAGQRRLLGPINIDLAPGLTAIVGPNGSGKSTFLQALAGVLPRELNARGKILSRGVALEALSVSQRAKAIAWLAQDTPSSQATGSFQTSLLTVEGLVALSGLAQAGWMTKQSEGLAKAFEHYLQVFDLNGLKHEVLHNISRGELQRAQLARVFAVNSATLLLDEPSNHLDLQHQLSLERAMITQCTQADRETACIYSTHDLNFALKAAHLVLMKNGLIIGQFKLSEASDEALQSSFAECFDTEVRVIRFEGLRQAIRM